MGVTMYQEICITDIARRYTTYPFKPGRCRGKKSRRGRTCSQVDMPILEAATATLGDKLIPGHEPILEADMFIPTAAVAYYGGSAYSGARVYSGWGSRLLWWKGLQWRTWVL